MIVTNSVILAGRRLDLAFLACRYFLRRYTDLSATDHDVILKLVTDLETVIGSRKTQAGQRLCVECGNSEGIPEGEDAESMTTTQAAVALGISPRQVRNLAPRLGGHSKPNGRWVIDRDAVTAEATKRRDEE